MNSSSSERDSRTPKKARVKRRSGQRMSAKQRAEAQDAFLDAFAQTANVTLSCEVAGIARSTVYEWQEHDEAFSLRYAQAEAEANDRIRAEIHRRAIDGWDEPVYQLGHLAGTVRKYSDTLLIFHAKARMPEYREKVDVKAQIQSSVSHDINLAQDAEAASHANAFFRRLTQLRAGDAAGPGISGE